MKKLLLTLGTVGGVIAPIAAVVSCGENINKNKVDKNKVTIDDVKNLKLEPLFNGSNLAKDFFDLKAKILSPDYHGNLESDFIELKSKKGNIEVVWNNYLNDIKEKINESNVDQSFKDDLIKRLFDEVNDWKIGDNILKELDNKIYDGKWGFVKHTDGFVFSDMNEKWGNHDTIKVLSTNLQKSNWTRDFQHFNRSFNWKNWKLNLNQSKNSIEIIKELWNKFKIDNTYKGEEFNNNENTIKFIYKINLVNNLNNTFNIELNQYSISEKNKYWKFHYVFNNLLLNEDFFKNPSKLINNVFLEGKDIGSSIKYERSLIKITLEHSAYTYYSHYHGFYEFATFDKKDTLGEPVNIYLDKTINDYYNWIIENDTNNGLKIKIKDTFKNKDLSELSVDDLLIAENKNVNKDASGKETFNSTLTYDSTNKWFNYHSVGKIKFLGATKNGIKTDLKFQLLVRTGKDDIDKTITVKPKEFTITI